MDEASNVVDKVTTSPLWATDIGVVLAIILCGLVAVAGMYFWKITIPNAEQKRTLEAAKAQADIEAQKMIAESTVATKQAVQSIDGVLQEQVRQFHEHRIEIKEAMSELKTRNTG